MILRALTLAFAMALASCGPAPATDPAAAEAESVRALAFLEGRWSGQGPDGAVFYEKYDFPELDMLRSQRFPTSAFENATDFSTVMFENGEFVSRWGDFSWKGKLVAPGHIAFEPVNAPSAFSWRRIDDDTVEVIQKFTENGKAKSFSITLNRIVAA